MKEIQRTVTIPLDEYEELTDNKTYRYHAQNGKVYTYHEIPSIKEIDNVLRKDYNNLLKDYQERYYKERSHSNNLYDEICKIPKWIRKIYKLKY